MLVSLVSAITPLAETVRFQGVSITRGAEDVITPDLRWDDRGLPILIGRRKTAVAARRVALQRIQDAIVCVSDSLCELLRRMTRMQLIRTLAAQRPNLTAYRDVEVIYRISLKSLAQRDLDLHDEIADLNTMIGVIGDELAPEFVVRNAIG